MTTLWASPASTRWCTDCDETTLFDLPGGPGSPEACCTECGAAVFLWVEDIAWDAPLEVLAA